MGAGLACSHLLLGACLKKLAIVSAERCCPIDGWQPPSGRYRLGTDRRRPALLRVTGAGTNAHKRAVVRTTRAPATTPPGATCPPRRGPLRQKDHIPRPPGPDNGSPRTTI